MPLYRCMGTVPGDLESNNITVEKIDIVIGIIVRR